MAGQFEIKPLQGGQFHFVLFDSDGQLLFTGEPCPAIADARAAIAALKERAQAFPNFERKKTADNKMYYTIRTANGKVLGNSELHGSIPGLENSITALNKTAPHAAIIG
jgi:uncharacterized protein YegP (UPF0339 family)